MSRRDYWFVVKRNKKCALPRQGLPLSRHINNFSNTYGLSPIKIWTYSLHTGRSISRSLSQLFPTLVEASRVVYADYFPHWSKRLASSKAMQASRLRKKTARSAVTWLSRPCGVIQTKNISTFTHQYSAVSPYSKGLQSNQKMRISSFAKNSNLY